MFGFSTHSNKASEAFRQALNNSLSILEFDPSGVILAASDKFCETVGYSREEIIGKRHAMLVDPVDAQSQQYHDFLARLGRGEFITAESRRVRKGGQEFWSRASYNPALAADGRVERIVAVIADVTAERQKKEESEAKVKAISHCQMVAEFTPEGEVLDANQNFLRATGHSLDEIKGRNHRMFVHPAYVGSPEYLGIWAAVNRGEPVVGIFHRNGKGGKPMLLQASYNPIVDFRGRVTKVVKFAIDLSDLANLGKSLVKLAAGAIHPIDKPFQPMFERIRLDFNAAQEKLKTTMLSITESSDLVAASAKEVTSAAEDLSFRTEQQAGGLEETSGALSAVTETVRKTADGAGRAHKVVGEARSDAERSGEIVGRAVDAMGRIEKSSRQIGQIIGVIDEIAFQTNLLALNAGVEAARAGDAGRGFAVVASEVRALAQRSAEAAKQIKGLISASTEEVGEGVKLVAETGDALSRIIGKVGEVNSLVTEIAADADEQSTSLHEVNAAVAQMDDTVQQNAAMAEESTAASRSLMVEAAKLAELIAQFNLGGAASEDAPRRELKRAAPHAVAPRAAAPPVAPHGSAPKCVAAGGGRTSDGKDN